MADVRKVIEDAQQAVEQVTGAAAASLQNSTVVAFCRDGTVYVLNNPKIDLPLSVQRVRAPRPAINKFMDDIGVP